jgi:hypothetical protein
MQGLTSVSTGGSNPWFVDELGGVDVAPPHPWARRSGCDEKRFVEQDFGLADPSAPRRSSAADA